MGFTVPAAECGTGHWRRARLNARFIDFDNLANNQFHMAAEFSVENTFGGNAATGYCAVCEWHPDGGD